MTHFSKRTPVGADLCVRPFTGSARVPGEGRTRRLPEVPGSRKQGGHAVYRKCQGSGGRADTQVRPYRVCLSTDRRFSFMQSPPIGPCTIFVGPDPLVRPFLQGFHPSSGGAPAGADLCVRPFTGSAMRRKAATPFTGSTRGRRTAPPPLQPRNRPLPSVKPALHKAPRYCSP